MAMSVQRSTCVDLYKFADVFSVDRVRKACLQLIHKHFAEVTSSKEFCSLSVNQLTEIISHDKLEVKEETTVWEAVVRWLQHSREDRLYHLPSILPHIRFNLLTSDDTAVILEHPLIKEDPGSSEVVKNAAQKGNPNHKPRFGMMTEMALLFSISVHKRWGSNEMLYMNPQEGMFFKIRCSNDPEVVAKTVTSDNDIYILTEASGSEDELFLFKYNQMDNEWEQKASVRRTRGDDRPRAEHLVEADGHLYYLARVVDQLAGKEEVFMAMERYNQRTDQWHSCTQLQLEGRYGRYDHGNQSNSFGVIKRYNVVSCDQCIYVFSDTEMHRYNPSQKLWCRLAMPTTFPELGIVVAMGTEIFCAEHRFSNVMVYDTETDSWRDHELPTVDRVNQDDQYYIAYSLFVLENHLHALLSCRSETRICVYDRSTATWSDAAGLPVLPPGHWQSAGPCPVARMYLPYIKTIVQHTHGFKK
ncbi:kelch repeat and BTB domain-containing protein 8-like [Branchiostoma floridae]|uniref:Kelch repeat and BTB domain-containing protein 8-like n=1 Tax=Branchiostoma floridae TaxID=7739 RepID=A0A9J7LWY3_BRAFL|nr:kelch repeat and BTB domain-containing protein 8-like [Branchiostoma floridae]